MAELKDRQKMPHQEPDVRAKNFQEVALGFTEEQALQEASRCLGCKKAQCVAGCPVGIDIPAFIGLIKEKKYKEALLKIKEKNNLPAICGRVCPQEEQCEKLCVIGKKHQPVSIGYLERFVADWVIKNDPDAFQGKRIVAPNVPKVAVVGSGPAGLTCAADLAREGFKVTIFEALHLPGGVLSYGIPEFRLPKSIVELEVAYVKSLGVELLTDVLIGRTLTLGDLFNDGYKAIFVGSGAGLPKMLNIPGENLNGVYSANEFLVRVNLMKAYLFPEYLTPVRVGRTVAVVGGGNTAMDSARCAMRLGAKRVVLIYRRGREEMPARADEIYNAIEEGMEPMFLTLPLAMAGDDKGCLKQVECQKMSLGEPDASGRRRPVPLEGSNFIVEIDTLINALGNSPNPLIAQTAKDLKVQSWGGIIVDEQTGATSFPGVYAGGDVVSGGATVISAMGEAKRAARAIAARLSS